MKWSRSRWMSYALPRQHVRNSRTVTAEDFAHKVGSPEVSIEVEP